MKYIVIMAKGREELEVKVNGKTKEGYEPLGGVSVSMIDIHMHLAQAMIKR